MVGRKKARPWTVMLLRRKTRDVDRVRGLRMPAMSLAVSILSRTSVVPSRSLLTRAIARLFSSSLSHLAESGRSVSVTSGTVNIGYQSGARMLGEHHTERYKCQCDGDNSLDSYQELESAG